MSSAVLFSCDYPIYTVGQLRDAEFYVAGGGGQAKTGVPNALDIHRLRYDGSKCVSVPVHHHDMGTRLIMNSAPHPKRPRSLAVGVGGECCVMEVKEKEGEEEGEGGGEEGAKGEEEATSGSKVRRRKAAGTEKESGTKKEGPTLTVVDGATVQTDFSPEPYQRVAQFTCDGGRVVTGGAGGVLRVWKYPSLKKVFQLEGHCNEIEDISCHPSEPQMVSVCRNGVAIVWDLESRQKETSFTWSPGQRGKKVEKPQYKFRACCFSPGQDHTSLFTLNIPMKWSPKKKLSCFLLKWDAGTWMVEEKRNTGRELLSALAVDSTGRYVGVGTGEGAVMMYSSDLELLRAVSGVHTVFVTGLAFLPITTKPSLDKPDKLVLISVSADRTCSATLVSKASRASTVTVLFIVLPLLILFVTMVTKYLLLW